MKVNNRVSHILFSQNYKHLVKDTIFMTSFEHVPEEGILGKFYMGYCEDLYFQKVKIWLLYHRCQVGDLLGPIFWSSSAHLVLRMKDLEVNWQQPYNCEVLYFPKKNSKFACYIY